MISFEYKIAEIKLQVVMECPGWKPCSSVRILLMKQFDVHGRILFR
jgi:hypothetical protein